MAQSDTRTTKQLFREWRSGDREAGNVMAQRFADWFYAVSVARLGESQGGEPCQAACRRFAEGVVEVTESRALVPWAHAIIQDELERAGGRLTDGDEPNVYTGNQSPKALLIQARRALPDMVQLLQRSYSGGPEDEVVALAAPLGGHPIGILRARYTVKKWLRENAGVPFEVTPDEPILDRAPLPIYESGQMGSLSEEESFEQWMITDIDLCRDIAEFAHFAIALRGGLPTSPPDGSRPQVRPTERPVPAPLHAANASPVGRAQPFVYGGGILFAGLAVATILLAIGTSVILFLIKG